jgi:CheY-like chemotaxis protein
MLTTPPHDTQGKPCVLICEDQGLTIMQFRKTLVSGGYEVVGEVSNAPDAIQIAMTSHLDLILMDLRLSGPMNGIEAAREILSHHFVPIVIVTASAEEERIQEALEAGVCGFIPKPITSDKLLPVLKTILSATPNEKWRKEVQDLYDARMDTQCLLPFSRDSNP